MSDPTPNIPGELGDPDLVRASAAQQRKVFAMCTELGLSSEDRHEFASLICGEKDGQPIHSFSQLTVRDAGRMIDAMNGWHAVSFLRSHNNTEITEPPAELVLKAHCPPH